MVLFNQFRRIKAFIFAVDGVCTDGGVWIGEGGLRCSRVYSRDRYALQAAAAGAYPIAVVGEKEDADLVGYMEGIGINDVFLDKGDKSTVLRDWVAVQGVEADQILYMGSDMPDIRLMKTAGFIACPMDAIEEVKAAATYVSPCGGGAGAVRDVIEKVMKLQGTWDGVWSQR